MKASIVTSAVVHGLVLVWALVTIGAPKSFEVQPDESTPVEIVTDVSMTQTGDKKAPQKDKAAPKPTTKQTEIANAQNAGENDVDLKSAPKPVPKPTENQSTGAPKKVEAPTPKVDPTPNDVKSVEKEETDVAPPPPTPTEAPKPPTPTPVPTPTPPPIPTPTPPPPTPVPTQDKAELAPSDQATPDNVPVPQIKPQPPAPPKVAEKPVEKPPEKKPETKPAEKPVQTADKSSDTDKKKDDKKREMAKAASSKESDFDADEISALLNKQQATGGGAKRQQQQAALGTDKPANGAKLSQSEIDALRSQIQNNWNVPAGMSGVEGMVIRVHMKLDESGTIVGMPDVQVTGGSESAQQALSGSATRAVMMSSPFKNLPRDKYDAWNEVIVNFDPSDLGL
ncbi:MULTISPECIES: hypothetical protein [Rhizobium]|uniref:Cell envelope integrity protein TolA n=1 Tax=Rhizobium rhododendri TaxID=2506430 RepID=A0ABY8IET4_9HYPH|nr:MULTISPECIES: hypothetical protein [Rhizobium]MBZ5758997.1 hypothetical protein [Rhizobium sp. VS19-DR96]MBZ5764173.1 hypothetical protein [Rhizobium sp. VS19-DR129.2]MBZ5771716.1 hypothetical protein [Rhizobium sp. VS19-DRK62.2]MBZ5783597.1 hypothetical protein [Rhizobium sp. VS19-DR121]MBZ5801729.1 hypothetical protein [Rhizobium sp. VS19-DR181]